MNVICALPRMGNTIVCSLKRGGEAGQYLVVPLVSLCQAPSAKEVNQLKCKDK